MASAVGGQVEGAACGKQGAVRAGGQVAVFRWDISKGHTVLLIMAGY